MASLAGALEPEALGDVVKASARLEELQVAQAFLERRGGAAATGDGEPREDEGPKADARISATSVNKYLHRYRHEGRLRGQRS